MLQMERYTLNYQLFKRNNTKKYLSLVMIGLSLMLSGCNKDDNNDPDTPPTGDTGEVRYEATVSDPENFKLLIHYTVGVDISSEAPEEAAIAQARDEGKSEGISKVARKMLEKKMDIALIMEITGLTKAEIEKL